MIWNLAELAEARLIPLAAENNERGLTELWPAAAADGSSLDQVFRRPGKGRLNPFTWPGLSPRWARAVRIT